MAVVKEHNDKTFIFDVHLIISNLLEETPQEAESENEAETALGKVLSNLIQYASAGVYMFIS